MTARGVRVIKVGGSLFDYAGFLPAWKRWSAEQPPAAQVLIAGGGKLADAIREADTVWGLGDETAHWLCIDTLAVSASRMASASLPPPAISTWAAGGCSADQRFHAGRNPA